MDIEVGVDGPVMALKLNRPGKKNAITAAMYGALADALERAASDPSFRWDDVYIQGLCPRQVSP